MSNPVPAYPADVARKPNLVLLLAWTAVLTLIAYFVWKYALHYFVFTPQSYGTYFWPRISWVVPHVAAGLVAILIGPLQFWPRLRRDHLAFHRIAGRVYVTVVLVGAIAALGLAAKIDSGPAYALGLAGLAVAWLTTTGMAFVAIRRKNVEQHRQWMIRSYVVTFAFVTFRLCDDAMHRLQILSDDERSKVLAWACWAVPLLVTELILQSRAVFKTRG